MNAVEAFPQPLTLANMCIGRGLVYIAVSQGGCGFGNPAKRADQTGVSESALSMLPFANEGEAELAVGRGLSWLESLWLHYTASVPDRCLYFFNVVFLFLVFIFAPLPTLLIDVFRLQAFGSRKIQPAVYNPPSTVWRCFGAVLITFFGVVAPLQLVSYPVVQAIGIRAGLPLPSFSEIFAQITVYFLIEDYTNYWLHRWLHTGWAYKNIHYMHHQFTAPVSIAAPYAHWAEILVLGIPSVIGPALVPGHMITLWLWLVLRQVEAIDTHCGYEFPWSPTKLIPFYGGSDYHDYHHFVGGKSQSNFASVFTYCDFIYGTDKGYRFQKDMIAQMKKQKPKEYTMDEGSKSM